MKAKFKGGKETMKKFFTSIIAVVMLVSLLFTGCKPTNSTNASASSTPSASPEATPEPAPKNVLDEPVTLSYMAWNLGTAEENNLERQMLAKFQDLYPKVTIKIVEVPFKEDGTPGDYGEYLNTLASKKELPDVFMWTSVPDTAAAGWAASVTEFAENDVEYQNVVAAVRDGGKVNGNVYGIPFAMHLFGIIQNYTIFNELNVDPLPYTYTLDDMLVKIGQGTSEKYRGIDNFAIEDWGAMVLNDKIGFGTFDGEKYNFSSPEFARAIEIYKEVVAKGYTGNGSFSKPWLPEGVNWAWGEGYVALQYDATWSLAGMARGERPFEGDMVPLPNEKVVLVPDYIYIGANTQNKEAAYLLAKWMSFGVDGMKARIAINKANGVSGYSGLPLNAGYDKEIDDYFLQSFQNFPNFLKMYASLKEKPQNVHVEGFKVVPGYTKSRFEGDTGVVGKVDDKEQSLTMGQLITAIIKGEKQLADYAAEMDKVANKYLEEAKANLPK